MFKNTIVNASIIKRILIEFIYPYSINLEAFLFEIITRSNVEANNKRSDIIKPQIG